MIITTVMQGSAGESARKRPIAETQPKVECNAVGSGDMHARSCGPCTNSSTLDQQGGGGGEAACAPSRIDGEPTPGEIAFCESRPERAYSTKAARQTQVDPEGRRSLLHLGIESHGPLPAQDLMLGCGKPFRWLVGQICRGNSTQAKALRAQITRPPLSFSTSHRLSHSAVRAPNSAAGTRRCSAGGSDPRKLPP